MTDSPGEGIPKLTHNTPMVLATGRIVTIKEVCYVVGANAGGVAFRVVYYTDNTLSPVKGCKAQYRNEAWRECVDALGGLPYADHINQAIDDIQTQG